VKAEPDPEVLIPKEKPSELFEAQCPDCGKNFPIQSNRGMIETLCPHCQSILQLDTAVG
jgi:ribosomal protein S27E